MGGLISIAMTGINAAQAGLLTTSNNIANLSTEGYTRQRVVQASNTTVMTGAGGIGQGTHVVTIARMYSEALTKQVLSAQTSVSSLDTYHEQISQIDNMLADADAGLTPVMQEFFDAIQSVATNPSSTSSRQSMISAAETMVSSFQSMYSRLEEMSDGVNSQISSLVTSINTYTQEIGDINQQIITASAMNGQPANDLLDKRDQLVSELNKLVKVEVTTGDDGSYNVFVGSGQQLVVGSRVTQMAAVASAADPSRIVVGLVGAAGNMQELPESLISGGELGGFLSFRSQALDTSYNQLGLMASSMALTFNAQNELGQDMLGSIAGESDFIADFFKVSEPTVIARDSNKSNGVDPKAVVSATYDDVSYNGTNFYTNLTASDYRLSTVDGTNLVLTRLSDGKTWPNPAVTPAQSATNIDEMNDLLSADDPQGFRLELTEGSFVAGDNFLIQPTHFSARELSVDTSIAADPRLIAASAPARASAALTNQGSATVGSVSVGPGYSTAGLPLTLSVDASVPPLLTGFPAGSIVTVSVGSGASQAYGDPSDLLHTLADIPFTSGATYSIDVGSADPATTPSGISMVFSGVPSALDEFTVAENRVVTAGVISSIGVEDASNIVRLGKLQTQNTMSGGTATYQDDYAGFVNDIGNKTSASEISSSAQTALLSQATSARESVSGVNRDEEAAKLIEYQQAYQASAKILEIASNIFDTLLSIA